MTHELSIGFVGNPNCGKTTLFNAYTGANLKVANWPGVTVERVEGETSYKGRPIKVIDLPGIYSLTSYTIEEKVTRKCIEDGEVDVIINVVDASSLERNLYLTTQLAELGIPMVGGSDTHQAVQYGCVTTVLENACDTIPALYAEMRAGRYIIDLADTASFQVRTACLLKRTLKEVHALGGDYVSLLTQKATA